MASTIKLKKSSVEGKVPLTTDLVYGELALNYTDGKLYYKTASNTINYIANGGTFTNSLLISDTTESTSTTTGALVVNGGVGIGNNLYVGGLVRIKNTTTNTTSDTGALVVDGGAGFAGNIHVQGYGHFGLEPSIALTNPLAVFTGDANGYVQLQVQNKSPGTSASSDVVLTADDGTDTSNYVDLGVNSSQFNSGDWTISGPRDGYLYVADNSLTLGTDSAGTTVKIHVGGTLASDVVAIFREPATATTSSDTGAVVINGGFGVEGDAHIRDTLHIGPDPNFALQNTLIIGTGNIDDFVQLSIQNRNSGVSASTDYVATADDGDDTTRYIDLGINSSGYNDPTWTISGPRDGYLYVAGNNLTVGTDSSGTNVKIHVGGTFAENIVAIFNEAQTQSTSTSTGALTVIGGVGVSGNLYVGGEIVAEKLTIQYTTVTTTLIQTDDIIQTTNNTQSTSTTSGALIIAGGAGFGGNVYVGGTVYGTATTATDIAGGTTNQIVYQNAVNSTDFIVAPTTASTYLEWNGSSFAWSATVGPQGPTGFTGSQGVIGYTGSVGYTGSQGVIGFTGSQGEIGFTGSVGFTGSQGITGFTGSVGFTGSQGITGFTGSQGITGFTGSVGFTGSQGITGFTGSQGNIGFTGSQGEIGFTGSVGYTGSQGIIGFTGSQGNIGFTGSQGITGFTGSVGYTGSQGIIGFTGSQGVIGFTGSVGFTGSQGDASTVPGPTGPQGPIGFTGSVGFTGSQGSASTVPGPTGPTGPQGPQGVSSPFPDIFTVTNITQATSTITGALQITGGAGIGGNIYAGGNLVLNTGAVVGDSVSTTTLTTSVTLDSFSTSTYRSAKYVISISNFGLGQYQTSEVLLVHNNTDSFIQASSVFTGNKAVMNFTTQLSGGNALLQGAGNQTGANTNTVKISKVYIPI